MSNVYGRIAKRIPKCVNEPNPNSCIGPGRGSSVRIFFFLYFFSSRGSPTTGSSFYNTRVCFKACWSQLDENLDPFPQQSEPEICSRFCSLSELKNRTDKRFHAERVAVDPKVPNHLLFRSKSGREPRTRRLRRATKQQRARAAAAAPFVSLAQLVGFFSASFFTMGRC